MGITKGNPMKQLKKKWNHFSSNWKPQNHQNSYTIHPTSSDIILPGTDFTKLMENLVLIKLGGGGSYSFRMQILLNSWWVDDCKNFSIRLTSWWAIIWLVYFSSVHGRNLILRIVSARKDIQMCRCLTKVLFIRYSPKLS